MRICVLIASYEGSSSAFRDLDPYCDPSPWLPGHEVEIHPIFKKTIDSQIDALVARGFDVFINLCDGLPDEDTAGIGVVRALERHGLPYTGASSACFDPTRDDLKAACAEAGVDTPRWAYVEPGQDPLEVCAHLRYPLIVKHPNSYGSIGMGRDARVESPEALAAPVARMVGTFGRALIEEFIEGGELTVLVAEPGPFETIPRTWAPIQVRFPEGETFKHFDLKWKGFNDMRWERVTDELLAVRARDVVQRVYSAMGSDGYARCDLRVDEAGRLFMLDLNTNPGVFYPVYGSADEILSHEPEGHARFTAHIIDCALRRAQRVREVPRTAKFAR